MRQRHIYLLHFEPPFKGMRHYLGMAMDGRLRRRIDMHRHSRGARLPSLAAKQGSYLALAWTSTTFDEAQERRLKLASQFRRWCPLCVQKADHGIAD